MNVLLWAAASVLALGLLTSGAMKIVKTIEELVASGMGFAADLRPGTVRVIGGLEVLAALGLILPAALGFAPVLGPIAAVGVVLLMVGAAVTHIVRHEGSMVVVNLAILATAGFVAWGRFEHWGA